MECLHLLHKQKVDKARRMTCARGVHLFSMRTTCIKVLCSLLG